MDKTNFKEVAAAIVNKLTEAGYSVATAELVIKDAWEDYVKDQLEMYGNSFIWVKLPFSRVFIRDGDPTREYMASELPAIMHAGYDYKNLKYLIDDSSPSMLGSQTQSVPMSFRDRVAFELPGVELRSIPLADIVLRYKAFDSDDIQIIWKFGSVRRAVISGNIEAINSLPADVLQAIANDEDWAFSTGHIFHVKNISISGIPILGYGLPISIDKMFAVDEAISSDQMYK